MKDNCGMCISRLRCRKKRSRKRSINIINNLSFHVMSCHEGAVAKQGIRIIYGINTYYWYPYIGESPGFAAASFMVYGFWHTQQKVLFMLFTRHLDIGTGLLYIIDNSLVVAFPAARSAVTLFFRFGNLLLETLSGLLYDRNIFFDKSLLDRNRWRKIG